MGVAGFDENGNRTYSAERPTTSVSSVDLVPTEPPWGPVKNDHDFLASQVEVVPANRCGNNRRYVDIFCLADELNRLRRQRKTFTALVSPHVWQFDYFDHCSSFLT